MGRTRCLSVSDIGLILVISLLFWLSFTVINTHFTNKDEESNHIHIPDPIEVIRKDCGQLCNTSKKGSSGPFFDYMHTNINCKPLFQNPYIDMGHGSLKAPKFIPKYLLKDFTMDFRIPVRHWYLDRPYLHGKSKTPVWTLKMIEDNISKAKMGKLSGSYTTAETNALRNGLKHAGNIQNGRVLVIGSEHPWVEACALEAGAREVVTLEYGSIISEHPKVKSLTPYEFRMQYMNNSLGLFDAIVTFSSVEHSGLGRYGDALNPWGDIIAIARAWCVTRSGGSLIIGVPYEKDTEHLAFNAHRCYGKIRYPYLTTNWKQVYSGEPIWQRVFVFTK